MPARLGISEDLGETTSHPPPGCLLSHLSTPIRANGDCIVELDSEKGLTRRLLQSFRGSLLISAGYFTDSFVASGQDYDGEEGPC